MNSTWAPSSYSGHMLHCLLWCGEQLSTHILHQVSLLRVVASRFSGTCIVCSSTFLRCVLISLCLLSPQTHMYMGLNTPFVNTCKKITHIPLTVFIPSASIKLETIIFHNTQVSHYNLFTSISPFFDYFHHGSGTLSLSILTNKSLILIQPYCQSWDC